MRNPTDLSSGSNGNEWLWKSAFKWLLKIVFAPEEPSLGSPERKLRVNRAPFSRPVGAASSGLNPRLKTRILALTLWMSLATIGFSQTPIYRYATLSNSYGSVFFALNGSTGQLLYMTDMGETAGKWATYGETLRATGKNNLDFELVVREKGTDFYVIDGSTGQLYWTSDFGDSAAVWHSYGTPIRNSDRANLSLKVEPLENGTKFTALDTDTGQIYYMYDAGEGAGEWKPYGELIK